jgi:hypothetical protein
MVEPPEGWAELRSAIEIAAIIFGATTAVIARCLYKIRQPIDGIKASLDNHIQQANTLFEEVRVERVASEAMLEGIQRNIDSGFAENNAIHEKIARKLEEQGHHVAALDERTELLLRRCP